MKKILFSLLFSVFCMINLHPVYAAEQLLAFLPEVQNCYYLNGTLVTVEEEQSWHTFNYLGHTYFPIRIISELLGFQVQWQPESQSVQLRDNKRIITLTVGSSIAVVNHEKQNISIVPILQDGCTLIPLRTLAQLTEAYVLYQDGVVYYTETPFSSTERQQDWFRQIASDLWANNALNEPAPYNVIYEDGEAIPLVSLYKHENVEYLSQKQPYGIDKLFRCVDGQQLQTVPIANLTQIIGIWKEHIYYITNNENSRQYDLYRANLNGSAAQLLQASFCDQGLLISDKRNRFYAEGGKDYLRLQKISVNWASSSTVYLYQLTETGISLVSKLSSENVNSYVIVDDWCFSVWNRSGIDYINAQQIHTESNKDIYLPFVEIISLQKEQQNIKITGIIHDTDQITIQTYSCKDLLALAQ